MYVVGLTGPMGAGKSAVLQMLHQLGAATLQADDASRELLAPESRLLTEVRRVVGNVAFRPDGTFDRAAAAALVFSDPERLRQFEAVVHPPMVRWLRDRLAQYRADPCGPAIAVLEAAILTHMGARPLVDAVVRVYAPPHLCLQRALAKGGMSRELAEAVLNLHLSLGLFTEAADYVLDTTGSLECTRSRVTNLWHELTRTAAQREQRSPGTPGAH